MQSRLKEAVVLALGILGLGMFFFLAQAHVKDRDRAVLVRGLAEREVPADYVIWPIVYKELNDDLGSLYEAVQAKSAILEKFLLDNGIKKEEISYSSPDILDTDGEVYDSRKHTARYSATVVMTVASSNVSLVREIMAKQNELLKQGLAFTDNDYRYHKVYSFNALNQVKPAMIEEATQNAHAAAEKFAKDSHSRLGKIKTATQGMFSIEDRDENTPYIKKIRVVTNVQYFLED
ncbi:MAG: SIMPL domain-containing protein [Fibrobacter sp.]|nr:SIMPL domain-containing protein [Fibrobacter sp.]